MEYIRVGNIVNTFGIKGELKVRSLTDFVEDRFSKGRELYIHKDNIYIPVIVKNCREHKGFLLVLFEGLEDINLVEKYKTCDILIKKDDIPVLTSGNYFFDLKGCDVYYNDRCIGKVSTVDDGYQAVLRIDNGEKQILIPYVDAFIKNVNIDDKRIDVDVIEGML